MPGPKPKYTIQLFENEERELRQLVRSRKAPRGADNEEASTLIEELLTDTHYLLEGSALQCTPRPSGLAVLRPLLGCAAARTLPPYRYGKEVRRIFHKLRSTAIENFNEQFSSRVSLTATAKCPPRIWSTPSALHGEPSSSIDSPYYTASSMNSTCGLVSKPS